MPAALKDTLFSDEFIGGFIETCQSAYRDFDEGTFLALLFEDDWEQRELKDRMRHMTICLHAMLPEDYHKTLTILKKIAPHVGGFQGMIFSEFVEVYGQDHWDTSLDALELFTQYGSAEFAIRPFIMADQERAMLKMMEWAGHENEHVRRLASEGCRPRLPWAMALPEFKQDPSPILPILEKLKQDESEYVRRSVANNLNDISKDHPDLVLGIAERWLGYHAETDWMVRHALRTLLKQGNPRAMRLFGFANAAQIEVWNLWIEPQPVTIGEQIEFSFSLCTPVAARLRLDFAIDYVKKTGKLSRKVFKLSEKDYDANQEFIITKQWSFADLSTRTHYSGEHVLTIVVNGVEKAAYTFEVKEP